MNIEREYYENESFWTEAALGQTDLERVRLLREAIPEAVQSVADLGCGNGIFVNGLTNVRLNTVLGVDRSLAALRHVTALRLCASLERVPLRNRSFDLVCALEVLEHLPVGIFSGALAEIARVSACYVLVSVPLEQDLRIGLVECKACRTRFNPDFHMRSFDEVRIRTLMEPYGFGISAVFRIGPFREYKGVSRIRAATRTPAPISNPFATSIPCPVCGEPLPPGPPAAAGTNGERNGGGLKSLVKRAWPTDLHHRWIAGLYRRKEG